MIIEEMENVSEEIIDALDKMARDYNFEEYGLPTYDYNEMEKMKFVVMAILTRIENETPKI